MLHFDDPPPRKARIEIIPMIDVMMFLLVFFVLISLNVIPAFGVRTAVPTSTTAQGVAQPSRPVVVSVQADGSVWVDGKAFAGQALAAQIAWARQANPTVRFIVNADHGVTWQHVVDVMDMLRAQGVDAITFAMRKAPV